MSGNKFNLYSKIFFFNPRILKPGYAPEQSWTAAQTNIVLFNLRWVLVRKHFTQVPSAHIFYIVQTVARMLF